MLFVLPTTMCSEDLISLHFISVVGLNSPCGLLVDLLYRLVGYEVTPLALVSRPPPVISMAVLEHYLY